MAQLNMTSLIHNLREKKWKTPLYFYDLSVVQKNYESLKESLGERFRIFYSMKSNPHHEILKKMKGLGALVDISSKGEMERALSAGFLGSEMSFIGPGKTVEELRLCLENNIKCIVIESLEELQLLAELAKEMGVEARCCLRINPGTQVHTNGSLTHNTISHFGMDEMEAMKAQGILAKNPQMKLLGLHFYLKSQYLESRFIIQNFQNALSIAVQMQKHFQVTFQMINWGGGFGIPYFAGQKELDLKELKNGLTSFLQDEKIKELSLAEFFVESGRFLCGPAGVFVTQVLYTKESHGKKFAVCDGGMTQNQAAIGIGQILRRNFPVSALEGPSTEASLEVVSLVGPSCYSIDILAADVELPPLSKGSYVVIEQCGAYGPSFSPGDFLSRPKASEYVAP